MRKFTLLFVFMAFVGFTFAQVAKVGLTKATPENNKAALNATHETKGRVIWSEDFNQSKWISTVDEDATTGGFTANGSILPEGWSVYDGNNLGAVWHWSNVGPRGVYTSIADGGPLYPDSRYIDGTIYMPEGNTLSNGFIELESDFYNTTETGEMSTDLISMDSYLEIGPIDLSNEPYVLLEFNQLFRYCCYTANTLGVFVSNDYDPANATNAHWALYDTKGGTVSNTTTLRDARHASVNISPSAGGFSNVYLRFYHQGSEATHYYWLIDDVKLTVPPVNDVVVRDSWIEYIDTTAVDPTWTYDDKSFNFSGGYTYIPDAVKSKLVSFRAYVEDFGSADQTATLNVNIKKDNAGVFTASSDAQTFANGEFVDLNIYTAYTLPGKGYYQVSATVETETEDENPGNNGFGYNFTVDDILYSRVYGENAANFSTAGPTDWGSGGTDGDVIVQNYQVPAGSDLVTLAGLRFYFPSYADDIYADELAAIKAGKYSVVAKVYNTDDAGDPNVVFASSEAVNLSINDTASWVYVPFVDDGNLLVAAGGYWVGLECYNGNLGPDDDGRLRFDVGSDVNGPKQMYHGGLVWLANKSSWAATPDNYAIDLYINSMPVSKVNLTFNVDMTNAAGFEAANDTVYVAGGFPDWIEPGKPGSIMMTAKGNMIYTATVQVDPNQEVAYKYFINAGWNGGEWAGDPNRTVTIAGANVTVNDTWTGIKPSVNDSKLATVKLFPNPFNESITLSNLDNVSRVMVSNVLGQTVMSVNPMENSLTISTADFGKGVYFITIVDAHNNTRTEKVVKQ